MADKITVWFTYERPPRQVVTLTVPGDWADMDENERNEWVMDEAPISDSYADEWDYVGPEPLRGNA